MNASDLRALKAPLIALILMVAIGAGLVYYTNLTLKQAQLASAQQQKQLRDARVRLQKSGDEKDIIVRYLRSYQYLQRLGFAGDEQRINWLDGLRVANQQTQLFGVDYEISTQQPYPYANELDPGQLTLHQSLMKLSIKLLHEDDLMRFLATLAKQGAGVFSVNQCVVDRLDTGGSIRFQPNLRADCELAWITVRPGTPEDRKS
ncbi:MAG: hypothetical protein HY525_13640 [Betaproteobacteria bacterium]|nr:hypothetical protein [Betaproteobacteria bacterium]